MQIEEMRRQINEARERAEASIIAALVELKESTGLCAEDIDVYCVTILRVGEARPTKIPGRVQIVLERL